MILASILLSFGVGGDPISALLSENAGELVVLNPSAYINSKGELVKGSILMRGDKVLAAGAKIPIPPKALTINVDGVISPGFIDAFSTMGGEIAHERARGLTPSLKSGDGVLPKSKHWDNRLATGITSVHFVAEPLAEKLSGWDNGDPISVLAGWTSIVDTSTASASGPVKQTVGAYQGPFSSREGGASALPGVLQTLRSELPSVDNLNAKGVCAWVDSAQAVKALQQLANQHDFSLSLICDGRVASYGGALAQANAIAGLPIVNEGDLSPLSTATWKALHRAGVEVTFGSSRGNSWHNADDLRTTAIHFAQATGDSAAAMRALTANAASFIGSPTTGGKIIAGARGDLCLWSGHPLDSSSRLKAVVVGGQTVWSASPTENN